MRNWALETPANGNNGGMVLQGHADYCRDNGCMSYNVDADGVERGFCARCGKVYSVAMADETVTEREVTSLDVFTAAALIGADDVDRVTVTDRIWMNGVWFAVAYDAGTDVFYTIEANDYGQSAHYVHPDYDAALECFIYASAWTTYRANDGA